MAEAAAAPPEERFLLRTCGTLAIAPAQDFYLLSSCKQPRQE